MNVSLSLTPFDSILLLFAGGFAYFFYSIPPVSFLLQNYYRRFFLMTLLIVNILFSALFFLAVDQFFLFFHDNLFSSLPYLDQLLFFALVNSVLFFIIIRCVPFFVIKTELPYEQRIVIFSDGKGDLFAKALQIMESLGASVIFEIPEKNLIIAQTYKQDSLEDDKKGEYILELTFSGRRFLFCFKRYVHILCYPAHRGVFVEKEEMKKLVKKIGFLLH